MRSSFCDSARDSARYTARDTAGAPATGYACTPSESSRTVANYWSRKGFGARGVAVFEDLPASTRQPPPPLLTLKKWRVGGYEPLK